MTDTEILNWLEENPFDFCMMVPGEFQLTYSNDETHFIYITGKSLRDCVAKTND